ncbi:MAG: sulfatase-like hydrolase/transferase [Epsilonproteobacteria bacterium]|nr:sulfatase-like hydrolase/transferase [Campylobacterota bacterium]
MKNTLVALLFTLFIIGSDYLITQTLSLLLAGLFFTLILFITHFCKRYRLIYTVIFILGSLHHLFYSYFQRTISSTDIYLFFTHMEETLESFTSMLSLFIVPFILLVIGLLLLWKLLTANTSLYSLKPWFKYPIFLLLVTLNLNSTMGLQLLNALSSLSLSKPKVIKLKETPLYPKREAYYNIVLLIGESMKYSDYVESKLKEQVFFYKKIYAGATNTDVAVPLLLNAKSNPLELNHNNESNVFKLAKRNRFATTFVSIQSEKSLQYIKPYLQTKEIDVYKSYSKEERKPAFDFLLLEHLNAVDWSQNNFIVMQQVGQHSPYYFFQGEKSDDIATNYQYSIDYSFKLYEQIENYLQKQDKPFIFIYASDHGEFTGEGGRYGHNSFDPTIYHVPMFMVSNNKLPRAYKNIKSHYHLSQLLIYLLGYKEKFELSKAKSIVNGTMLSREDGFIEIE